MSASAPGAGSSHRTDALLTVVRLAIVAWVAYAVTSGFPARLHNADSLIPVFVSLEGWTPFFWGQDRFGMLLALVAWPIRDGFWNLVAQNMLGIVLFVVGSAAAFARCRVPAPLAAALTVLLLLMVWPAADLAKRLLTTDQSYAPAIGLFGGGLFLCRSTRTLVPAIGLMMLGAWTNAGVALLVLIVASIAMCAPTLRAYARPVWLGTLVSLAAHRVLQMFMPGTIVDTTHVTVLAVNAMPARLATFAMDGYVRVSGWGLFPLLAAGAAAFVAARMRREVRAVLLAASIGSVVYALVMVLFFNGLGRHLAPALALALIAVAGAIGVQLPAARTWSWLATAVVAAAVTLVSGVASPPSLRRQLIEDLGFGHAMTFYDERVSVITGDYWSVWPATFAVNLLHERVTGRRPVLPVALRGEDLFLRRRSQIGPATIVAFVPADDKRYWTVRGPRVELTGVRWAPGYEIHRVIGDGPGATGRGGSDRSP